ncbi:hypothetical protein [Candidatus Epulonipiscium viviparus]|uniref:hypothetical protein n=1 Tax=Candidatus Epulonipiscium viviparus TaxID=420336 RepID=UPI0027380B99|nr:hypothetical protein [Candidatus Epulopiscium viviparus]
MDFVEPPADLAISVFRAEHIDSDLAGELKIAKVIKQPINKSALKRKFYKTLTVQALTVVACLMVIKLVSQASKR